MTTRSWRTVLSIVALGVSVAPAGAQAQRTPIELKAADGIALKATYYSPGKPGPGLVLLHQCNRDRAAWHQFATDAAGRGYHVITMDYRGYGESEGERFQDYQQQGPVVESKWPGDVDAAFAWLVAQQGVDRGRIGAAGASCGVNQSVLLARRHPEVKTLMLLSGNTTPAGREHLRASPWLSVLGVASEDDGPALPTMRWILGWSANPKNRLVEYKAAGHGTDMFAVEQGLQPLMLDWLDANLRTATARPSTSTVPNPTPVQAFWGALAEPGGVARARAIYDVAQSPEARAALFPEGELNAYGYQLLQDGRAADAVIVFEMNVSAYPRSANTYDSLSDALLAAGRQDEALRHAERALAALESDTTASDEFKAQIRQSAEDKIRRLTKKN
jgi:dienelactone hydrolase